jgi:hypothetical protein
MFIPDPGSGIFPSRIRILDPDPHRDFKLDQSYHLKTVVEFCLDSRHVGSPEVRVMRDAEIDQSTSIHLHVPVDQSLFTNCFIHKIRKIRQSD